MLVYKSQQMHRESQQYWYLGILYRLFLNFSCPRGFVLNIQKSNSDPYKFFKRKENLNVKNSEEIFNNKTFLNNCTSSWSTPIDDENKTLSTHDNDWVSKSTRIVLRTWKILSSSSRIFCLNKNHSKSLWLKVLPFHRN